MKRIAHIEKNLIVNVSLAQDDAPLAPNTMLESDALAAGYTYKNTTETQPIVVSMRSFREACGRELTSEISAYIATIEDLDDRFKAQNDFEFAATVSRVNFRVSQIASELGKTETEIDEVFALAQQLDAT
jgi:hypothetical protein